MKEEAMKEGRLKFFNFEKCYGFIVFEGEDIYFDCAGILDESPMLMKGCAVTFEMGTHRNKPRAKNVCKMKI